MGEQRPPLLPKSHAGLHFFSLLWMFHSCQSLTLMYGLSLSQCYPSSYCCSHSPLPMHCPICLLFLQLSRLSLPLLSDAFSKQSDPSCSAHTHCSSRVRSTEGWEESSAVQLEGVGLLVIFKTTWRSLYLAR